MYYKITDKESSIYKELHELRTKELQIEKDNVSEINKKTGLEWTTFLGYHGQQNFRRVTQYSGFEFKNPELVDKKTWKPHEDHPNVFVPNRRTKSGREMSEFLMNGLKGSNWHKVLDIFNLEHVGRFTLPYLEIKGDSLLLFLDDKWEPDDASLIEITKKEFYSILKEA